MGKQIKENEEFTQKLEKVYNDIVQKETASDDVINTGYCVKGINGKADCFMDIAEYLKRER
jgi:hypothetical protein